LRFASRRERPPVRRAGHSAPRRGDRHLQVLGGRRKRTQSQLLNMTIYNDGATISNGTNAITGVGSELMSSPANITQNATITANLIRTVNIKNVRAVSSTRIRVEFSQPVSNNAD